MRVLLAPLLLVLLLHSAACRTPAPAPAPTPAPAPAPVQGSGACWERPQVAEYLKTVHGRTLARWKLPRGTPANQEVSLLFSLDDHGAVTRIEVLSAPTPAMGRSAADALLAAAPFPPLPAAIRCLAGIPISGSFRNPIKR